MVLYDDQLQNSAENPSRWKRTTRRLVPEWLRDLCGRDMFYRAVYVGNLPNSSLDRAVPALRRLPYLQKVYYLISPRNCEACVKDSEGQARQRYEQLERELPGVEIRAGSSPIVG